MHSDILTGLGEDKDLVENNTSCILTFQYDIL